MKRSLLTLLLALVAAVSFHPAHAAPNDVGVVLLHGKWGAPASMDALARELESHGYRVSVPEMAWSGRRLYDVDYPAALKEIEAQVRRLRANGAKRVLVAGQSLGANAAAAYAFSGLDLDGLVILSPGHFPERGMGKQIRASLDRANSMVSGNRGGELESFEDVNQGRQRSIRTTAAIYVSYFNPDGLGAMTKTLRKLPKPLPLLLVIGTQDPFYGEAKALFDSAPANPGSRYVVLQADHFGIPSLVAAELLKWLESSAN
jgi:pimeloyl-ACP methyl ester carboxylesterase